MSCSQQAKTCLLYTSDAADERSSVDLGGRRIIKKKNTIQHHVGIITDSTNKAPNNIKHDLTPRPITTYHMNLLQP